MVRQFEIFAGGHRVEITATTKEARAYACGMSEAFRMAGRPTDAEVYNFETGKKVFSTSHKL